MSFEVKLLQITCSFTTCGSYARASKNNYVCFPLGGTRGKGLINQNCQMIFGQGVEDVIHGRYTKKHSTHVLK